MNQADEVASVILARSGPWTDAYSLQKLLYYVQAWHLAVTNEPAFQEKIKAWRNGPVVPQVWHSRKEQASRRATDQNTDGIELDALTSDLVDMVIGTYGSMSGEELSALTHVERPWQEARGDLPEDADGQEVISTESMARYYRAHRKLDGRTAADLAAGGLHLRSPRTGSGPVDVDELLASVYADEDNPGDDPWGSANAGTGDFYSDAGIVREHGRAHSDW